VLERNEKQGNELPSVTVVELWARLEGYLRRIWERGWALFDRESV